MIQHCLHAWHAVSYILLLLLATTSTAQENANANPEKRGIAYIGTRHPSDYNIFLGGRSPITWYFNWSPNPVRRPSGFDDIEFVPLIHGLDNLDSDLARIRGLPERSTHLLTFNEPDLNGGGGSDISPEDAARAYVERIAPLSIQNGGRWHISHPSTTGTGSGLNWLRSFNSSCYEVDAENGCPIDFIATHFYGDFPALASWLGQLDEFYNADGIRPSQPRLGMWITEVALPQASATQTLQMMNTTVPYLDSLGYVEKYSWFGIFRGRNANEWTGDGVALLDDGGGLTGLGARYLSTDEFTFVAGMSAQDAQSGGGSTRPRPSVAAVRERPLALLLLVVIMMVIR